MAQEHDFGNYDLAIEITESALSDKLNGLYESAGLTGIPFGKIRLFGENHSPFVFTPEGWRELAINISECGEDVMAGDDETEKKPWFAKLKDAKAMPFKKKIPVEKE